MPRFIAILLALWLGKEIEYYFSSQKRYQKQLKSLQEEDELFNHKNNVDVDQLQNFQKDPHPFPFVELREFLTSCTVFQLELLLKSLTGVSNVSNLGINQLRYYFIWAIYLRSDVVKNRQDKVYSGVQQYVASILGLIQQKNRILDEANQSNEVNRRNYMKPVERTTQRIHTPWLFDQCLYLHRCYHWYWLTQLLGFQLIAIGQSSDAYNFVLYRPGSGEVLIYFPGIAAGINQCATLAQQFPNCTVIVPLFPASAQMGPINVSIFDFNRNLLQFLVKQCHANTVSICAWSFGCVCASRFVLQAKPQIQVERIVFIEPALFMWSCANGYDWFHSDWITSFQKIKSCLVESFKQESSCKATLTVFDKWMLYLQCFVMNYFLHTHAPCLASNALSVFRCVWNVSDWDLPSITYLLSANDPLTVYEYKFILSRFKHAQVIVESGTHGSWCNKFNRLKQHL